MITITDINSFIKCDISGAKHLIVAGSGTDNVEVTGETLDRLGYYSGVLEVGYIATLAASETLSITITEQQSDDGSSWDTATSVVSGSVVATGEAGGSTEKGVYTTSLDFSGKKQYLRYNITADLSASSTDTASWVATMIKGGAVELPAS